MLVASPLLGRSFGALVACAAAALWIGAVPEEELAKSRNREIVLTDAVLPDGASVADANTAADSATK